MMNEEMKNMELNEKDLEAAAGGNDGMGTKGHVSGLVGGYLAVRSSAREGSDNQLGGLLNGDAVTIYETSNAGYVWVRAYCKKTAWTNETGWQTGWVNKKYVVRG